LFTHLSPDFSLPRYTAAFHWWLVSVVAVLAPD